MAKKSTFLEIVREQLQPRFEALIQHGEDYVTQNFEEISQRMLWYICVGLYKTRTGTENLDIAGDENTQYGNQFLKAIKGFCENKENVRRAVEIDAKYGEYWGILRKALNIEAKGRAICYGASGNDVMVVPSNKRRYINAGLFAVICEKETFGKKWLAEMNNRGWGNHITLIITQGFSSCEVIETLMELKENVENNNTEFYVGVLHDCDIPGYTIMEDINGFFDIMDFGATFELLDQHDSMCWENLKEIKRIPTNQSSYLINIGKLDILRRFITSETDFDNVIKAKNGDSDDDTIEEVPKVKKNSKNKNAIEEAINVVKTINKNVKSVDGYRLELDKLYVNIGITPFCDYAEQLLAQHTSKWDLNRVSQPYCSSPDKYDQLERKITDIWRKIVLKATGKDTWELNFTDCAQDKLNEFIRENRHYEATIEEVKNLDKIIQKQSRELQGIVDNDESNIATLNSIETLVNEIVDLVDSNDESKMKPKSNGNGWERSC